MTKVKKTIEVTARKIELSEANKAIFQGANIFDKGKWRPVIIQFEPPCLLIFRAKGLKKKFTMTFSEGYCHAVKMQVRSDKKEKTKAKKKKKISGVVRRSSMLC